MECFITKCNKAMGKKGDYNMINYEKSITREEALSILLTPDDMLSELLLEVSKIRKKYKGNKVGVHLLTNARSGDCTQNCAYCAQSHQSKANIEKYRFISQEKLLENGKAVEENHLSRHCIGLSGIRFTDDEIIRFAESVKALKEKTETPICCSIGFLTPDQAMMLKNAGVDRINHNLNTSRKHYPNICTTHTYEERVENIKMLKNMGFEICCGGIIGLGEEEKDVVDMLFEISALSPNAVPINFLIPIEGTSLENTDISGLTPEYCLKVLCLARILNPKADIRCAAGREVYLKGREREMFCAADSIFASGYLTAQGQEIGDTIKMIEDAGYTYYIES